MALIGQIRALVRPQAAIEALDDVALLAVCATGNRFAVAAFLNRFSSSVAKFVSRMVGGGNPDLDDLVQNTFIAAVESANRFAQHSTVRTWLLGIAANQARMYLRAHHRKAHAVAKLSELPLPMIDSPEIRLQRQQLVEL